MAAIARDIMTPEAEFLKTTDPVQKAAWLFAINGIRAAPICDTEGHLAGMVTDRDIVTKVVAEAIDPNEVALEEIADGVDVVTVGADAPVSDVLETMKRHRVRRLVVVDGAELVGIITQGDVARNVSVEQVGDLVAAISA